MQLNRQQIEHIAVSLKEETPWKHQVNYWLETDADLRTQLAAMTAERDALKGKT